MRPVVEDSPPEPSTSTGVTQGVTSRQGKTIKTKLQVIQENPVASGSDTPNDEIVMVEALIHEVTFYFTNSFHQYNYLVHVIISAGIV